MTTHVTVDSHELALAVENDSLIVHLVVDGAEVRRGSIFIGELPLGPVPVFLEPDPAPETPLAAE
ncbi:hypothetical protein BOX37_31250 [Nocardia mangyaensis]|uniref:Uncharacterized protein n=1 Tax=Nocardia mangyaensis TaxID=2213200 RepID=A0A1J0W0D6_9NOCA|nr:hypothetical protein [Nocardia mangyaensis]APE37673.1 hypothetical protein BOX37_31250 [Nocardia mangyaensis]